MERRDAADRRDDAQLWRVEALGGLELMRARYAEFTYSPHTHDEYMIALTEGGAALPQYRGGPHLVSHGDVMVLNPGEVHGGGPARGAVWHYRSFYVPVALMRLAAREVAAGNRDLPQFAEDVVSEPAVATRLWLAHAALEGPSSALERESLLLEALAGLIARHAAGGRGPRRAGSEPRAVKRAREYLEAYASENVSLAELAREAGLSPFHLCRVFRRETGLTPHSYQTLLRVRLAKTLLAQGRAVSQAALDAGFYDQAHLTRHFKRIFGVTPGRYFRRD